MRTRSPTISTSAASTTPKAAFMLASCFPVELTYDIPRVPVRACRSAPRIPVRPATSIAAPRMSTAWPPSRGAGARSTTVGQKPCLDSQYASIIRPARAGNQHIPVPHPGPPGCPAAADAGGDMGTSVCSAGFAGLHAEAAVSWTCVSPWLLGAKARVGHSGHESWAGCQS